MAVLMTSPFLQFFDNNGIPLSGGKVYTYSAGTTTNKATFTDQSGLIEHTNPVVLDPAGRAQIWLLGSYKFVIKDVNDVTIETTDNVASFTTTAEASDSFFQTFSGDGSTTTFTLSQSLGTDEKAIQVWVDAGAGVGYDIQNVSAYTINETSLTFNTAPATGVNNIYVSAPSLLVGSAAASADSADLSATAAANSATAAAESVANLSATSTTSLLIGIGSKVFTTQSGKLFPAGTWLLITSDADPTNYMHGSVTSYSGTTLTMNITNIGGTGTLADWTIKVSGTQGSKGDAGSIDDINGQTSATITANDEIIFGDVSDSNNTKKTTVQGIIDLSSIPVGTTIEYSGTTTPAGFLDENGAAVSRTTYSDLFTAIGTTYGVGDGSTTFNLPNQQRRVVVGSGGTGTGTLGNAVGDIGGSETHSLTTAENAAHTHTVAFKNDSTAGGTVPYSSASGGGVAANVSTTSSGSGAAHNNIQPSIIKMKCIKY